MYCITCLGVCFQEVLSGKSYKHLTLDQLQFSATSGCLLCTFLSQNVLPALRKTFEPGNVLRIFLERHSSAHRFLRRNLEHTDEILRLNAEDDAFRDGGIKSQSGYNSTLIAAVGRPEVAPPMGAAVEEREVCYVTLEFCTNSGEPEDTFDEAIARRVRQDPSDPSCYEMVSGWVQKCCEEHNCGPTTETQLPTRILEIGEIGEANLRLRISDGLKGRYVALSHCWGKRTTTTTTRSNINERLKSISLDTLPANFRDAVIISRELGYKYLWVDSLCIIQGDRDDWVTESSLMGKVYQNCSVMIAASGAGDSYGGMLNLRQDSCPLPESKLFLSPKRKPFQILEESELGSRAWASQERILAPRIIYYSNEQIFWECRDDRKAEVTIETLSDTYQSYNKRYHDRLPTNESYGGDEEDDEDDNDDIESTVRPEGWFWAIQGYSRRHLTNPGDKLPALSGLAQNVFDPRYATGGSYLAGIWSNDILRQLLWENGEDQVATFNIANYIPISSLRTITKLSRAPTYRGPSWSWVAYDGPIYNDRADDRVILTLDLDADHRERSQKWDLKIIGIDIRLASNDPFGQIQEGSNIVTEGICQAVVLRPGKETFFVDGKVECLWSFDVREMGSLEREYLCLQVGRRHGSLSKLNSFQNRQDFVKDRLSQLGVRCLILRKADGLDMWQRVGVFTFDITAEGDSGWKKKILTLT